jgi:hypothetical protein
MGKEESERERGSVAGAERILEAGPIDWGPAIAKVNGVVVDDDLISRSRDAAWISMTRLGNGERGIECEEQFIDPTLIRFHDIGRVLIEPRSDGFLAPVDVLLLRNESGMVGDQRCYRFGITKLDCLETCQLPLGRLRIGSAGFGFLCRNQSVDSADCIIDASSRGGSGFMLVARGREWIVNGDRLQGRAGFLVEQGDSRFGKRANGGR